MGRLRWSGWDGEYKYTPDAEEVESAQQNARFRQDVSRISGDAAGSVGDSFTRTVTNHGRGWRALRLVAVPQAKLPIQGSDVDPLLQEQEGNNNYA